MNKGGSRGLDNIEITFYHDNHRGLRVRKNIKMDGKFGKEKNTGVSI